MPGYLVKVRKKMDIYAQRRVRNVLAGNYGSVFKGRSMDFDDLREYAYGDDVKDIDWKATARSRTIMIRRYVAIRKHNIMIVADSGNSMAGLAPSGEKKSEVATFCAGVISYVAQKHSDLVGMVYGNQAMNKRYAMKEDTPYIENFLKRYEQSVDVEGPNSDINALLTYVSKSFRERMFLIVITDPTSAAMLDRELVRRLNVRHEQMFILVEDSPITNKIFLNQDASDLNEHVRLPHYFRANKKVAKSEEEFRKVLTSKIQKGLYRLGVVSTTVDSSDHAVTQIFKMLEEQKHVRR
jgi:uncharacterized protein (DUF58 family)